MNWKLLKSEPHPEIKATIYTYQSNGKHIRFYLHPIKAFCMVVTEAIGVKGKAINSFLDGWMENAIGPADEFDERIKNFEA